MIRRWFGAHRSLVATMTSGTVVVALIATVSLISGGYPAQQLDLGDAAVWVTNDSRQVVGRANTEVFELNTAVTAGSTDLDVRQHGGTVFVVDRVNNSLDILDPATATVADSVPLPPIEPEVFLAGNRTVISSNGDMWSVPSAEIGRFDSSAPPTLALGAGSVASMDPSGVFYSFSPATGDLSRVDTASGDAVVSTVTVDAGKADDTYTLTSVSGNWALLNSSTRMLFLEGGRVDLSDEITATGRPVLQQASVAGNRLLVAHTGGLISVPLNGGAPNVLVDAPSGEAAAPASADDCSHAAWADGTIWRSCVGDPPEGRTRTLDGVAGDARLEFRRNGSALVLNDALNGAVWAVQRGNELIDNWDDLIDTAQNDRRVEENNDDNPPEFEKAQAPPVAADDEFGARPGRAVALPVLLNDHDPNNDVLMITELTEIPAAKGRLDLVENDQKVLLTLPADAGETGRVTFRYTISDGHGGTASASVAVTVRSDSENAAPAQVRATRATVQSKGRVTSQVIGDWVDPDGDPIFLRDAVPIAPDVLSFTPDGAVTITDAGAAEDQRQIALVVSDGRLAGTGTLALSVRPSGSVPIVAEGFPVKATAGAEITVSPLGHVQGGSGLLRLTSVPAKPDVTITPDFDGGTFRFTSGVVGTHEIEYAVTDGQLTAVGKVRVLVEAPADVNSTPLTVPHTALLRGTQSSLVDVLATDADPAGGVLLITGTMNVPADSGLRVEILDQRILRVTLTKPLESGVVSFNYRVSNGFADAEGTVTAIELPPAVRKQAPIAVLDTVSVRVGDSIDIPVLANDEHPDGDLLSLDPALASGLPEGAGVLFASGTRLRYLAPDTTGNFTAVYRVNAPDGQFANAEVRISVREEDAASNKPPVPKTVTSRVLAGDTVRIAIPLGGIDPDGDSVQLLGQETNPEKGAVTEVGPGWIDYESGDYSAGTDTFTYTVIDALGKRATGLVRVGISPRLDGARNPVAVPDVVSVRPNSRVKVRVLSNDSDPDGGDLSITGVERSGGASGSAKTDGEVISVVAPESEGRYGYIYEIQNERGGTNSNFLTVVVRKDATRSHPDARDTHLTLTDVLDRRTVDVDVLGNVFFADGSARSLGLSVLPGFTDAATVTGSKRLRIQVGDSSQIIPFALTHPDDPGIVSYAFVWVPGYNDALPQLRTGVRDLSVPSESVVTIDINDYVIAVGGKTVRLTDESTVRATHADGSALVSADGRLLFRSAEDYYGPASISFEVTDGTTAADPRGRRATIVLPIVVTPRENQPPAFDGAVIDFEPDQTKVIDLRKLTTYPYPDDRAELAYEVLEPKPTGFSYSLEGHRLTLRAASTTPEGSRSPITIGVRDTMNEGSAGRIDMRVVASTRPLAIPTNDTAVAQRGQTTVVDVLSNDGAANPFPAVPLRVIDVRGLNGPTLPAGVRIMPSADNSRLSVSVSASAEPVDTNLQYQVADATGDPDRYAWGTVRISVQDKPDPVASVQLSSFGDRNVTASFSPGASNNSPITGYEVSVLDADSGAVLGTTPCAATSCTVPTAGNGSANGVRLSVTARNAIGLSAPKALDETVWSDVVPPPPTGLSAAPLDGGLRLSWSTVTSVGGGSPVRGYVVTVGGAQQGEVSASGPNCTAEACTLDVSGLGNGVDVGYTVSARNDAYPSLSQWTSSAGTGHPYGPARSGGITATGTDATGTVDVSWAPFDGNGDPIRGYYVQRLIANVIPAGDQACAVTEPAPGEANPPDEGPLVVEQHSVPAGTTSFRFDGLVADGASYYFIVWGYNGAGCAATPVASVLMRPPPAAVASVQGAMEQRGEAWDYHVTGVTPVAGIDHYRIRAQGDAGSGMNFSGQGWPREMLGGRFGRVLSFELQACAPWGTCGPWSGPFTSPEAPVTLSVTGLEYVPEAGRFAWTNAPDNDGLQASFQCSVPPGIPTNADSPNTCTLPDPAPVGAARLTVTVNGHSYNYDR